MRPVEADYPEFASRNKCAGDDPIGEFVFQVVDDAAWWPVGWPIQNALFVRVP